jgi:hypothetical protein
MVDMVVVVVDVCDIVWDAFACHEARATTECIDCIATTKQLERLQTWISILHMNLSMPSLLRTHSCWFRATTRQ